ncbi:hypothetical protein H5410_010765 [Solanum commersonii]|uniref:Uncharacterized protein n=1 Tax=Solanum commersonii TaxID=4109 RepID=A0A9J6AMQ0_SOLCO|nr:hypothetical protein H5410_010765 [Solanum commersonii]
MFSLELKNCCLAWHLGWAMTYFKAFELIRVLSWQSSVSFPPLPNHPFREITHDLPLFLIFSTLYALFINHEDVEVLSCVEVQ